MYRIEIGNEIIEGVERVDGQFESKREIPEIKGVKRIKIEAEDGFKKEIKKGKVKVIGEIGGKWRFTIKELSKAEAQEESRKKKIAEQNEWIKERYERITLVVPKGTKEKIKGTGNSVNGFINEAIKVMLEVGE